MTQIIRRCAIVALLLALVLAVSACKREKEPEPPTQPETLSAFLDGTKLNGIDLSGDRMAMQRLKDAAQKDRRDL